MNNELLELYNNIKECAEQEKATINYIKTTLKNSKKSYGLDPNYRLAWGKMIAYCSVMKDLQEILNIQEELIIDKKDIKSVKEQSK